MFYDQHIRDFILTKICYAGSHFFGNVTYPKEVRRSFCLSETCLEKEVRRCFCLSEICLILQCTQLLISPMPKKTHFPNNTMYVSIAHNMRINIAKNCKDIGQVCTNFKRGNLVCQVCENLADGSHDEAQKEVQSTVDPHPSVRHLDFLQSQSSLS